MGYRPGSECRTSAATCRRASVALGVLLLAMSQAGPARFAGQVSGWVLAGYDTSFAGQAGLRYIPSVSAGIGPVDVEVSVSGSANMALRAGDSVMAEARLKPYRAWLRLSSERFEARAGLQKINFGAALLLRPLQWFDRLDPRDPLSLTDGVYGLLARYWFQNNANVWAWGLAGNSVTKGWEVFPSPRWSPEVGGRAQIPVPKGEAALTFHHRRADLSSWIWIPEVLEIQNEDRFGLDARLDLGPGIWLEGAVQRQGRRQTDGTNQPVWQRAATVGADYTFGLGNGLLVTAEHLALETGLETFRLGQAGHASALMAGYPLGLVDNLQGIVFFDWAHRQPYAYLSWQRTLDNWIVSLAAFWNPDLPAGFAGTAASAAAGKGVRLTVIFNH